MSSGEFEHNGMAIVALSPDLRTVAVASDTTLQFFNARSGALLETLRSCVKGSIMSMEFDPESNFLVTSGREKHVYIWYNAGLCVKVRICSRESAFPCVNPTWDYFLLRLIVDHSYLPGSFVSACSCKN